MKWWWAPILMLLGSSVGAAVREYRTTHKTVPSFAGRVCDEVWNRTRGTDPTVGWYEACIREVAKQPRK